MSNKKLLGIVGSIVLIIGVFMPIISMPIKGNIDYFQNGKGDGVIVLILAGISLLLILIKKPKGLWFTGLGSVGIILFSFISVRMKLSQVKTDVESDLMGNPFRGLADMAMQSIQMEWGWAVLIIGSSLVIVSAIMKDRSKDTHL